MILHHTSCSDVHPQKLTRKQTSFNPPLVAKKLHLLSLNRQKLTKSPNTGHQTRKKNSMKEPPKKAVDHHSDPSNSGLLDIIMCPQKGHNKLQNCKCGKFCYGVSWAAAVVVGVFLVYRCIQVFVGGTFFCNPDFISEN